MVKAHAALWRLPRRTPKGRGPLSAWLRHRSSKYRHACSSLLPALQTKGRRRGRLG